MPSNIIKKEKIRIESVDESSNVQIMDEIHADNMLIRLGKFSRLEIYPNCHFSGFTLINIGFNSSVIIKSNLRSINLKLTAYESSVICIGSDCLFGRDCEIRASDGHYIYQNGERINKSKSVEIGDHVWLANEVLVLKGVKIGRDSVVGARSLVTKNIDNNCLAVGNPAKIIRQDIVWKA